MTWSKLFDLCQRLEASPLDASHNMQGDDERMKEIVRELRAATPKDK